MPVPAPVWVPPGTYDRRAKAVSQAVKEYDSRLGFGIHEENRQWVIFIRQGETEETKGGDLPILGFEDIPTPEDAKRRLYEADAVRRGDEILESIRRHNEELTKRFEDISDDASGQTAEHFEYFYRRMGLHPRPRIFVPGKVDDG